MLGLGKVRCAPPPAVVMPLACLLPCARSLFFIQIGAICFSIFVLCVFCYAHGFFDCFTRKAIIRCYMCVFFVVYVFAAMCKGFWIVLADRPPLVARCVFLLCVFVVVRARFLVVLAHRPPLVATSVCVFLFLCVLMLCAWVCDIFNRQAYIYIYTHIYIQIYIYICVFLSFIVFLMLCAWFLLIGFADRPPLVAKCGSVDRLRSTDNLNRKSQQVILTVDLSRQSQQLI